jgi:hypothetical protein
MDNLVRIIHRTDLDKKHLILQQTYLHIPKTPSISRFLNKLIEEVYSVDDAVTLQYFYGNEYTKRGRSGHSSLTLYVFPQSESVEYLLTKGDFWVNQGLDPIIIKGNNSFEEIDDKYVPVLFNEQGIFFNRILLHQNPISEYSDEELNPASRPR